jgi:hypothetical protein
MSLFFGEDDLFGKKGSRIIDSSDSSFTVNGSGKTLQIRPKADKYRIENGSLLEHTTEPIIKIPDSSPLYLPASPLDDSLPNLCPAPSQQKHSNKEEKHLTLLLPLMAVEKPCRFALKQINIE